MISLDFSERKVPKNARGIFAIDVIDKNLGEYYHPYMDFMNYGQRPDYKQSKLVRIIKKITHDPRSIFWLLKSKMSYGLSLYYSYKERKRAHDNYGTITFLKGTFNKIPLDGASVDAIVSISAFEHNAYDDMPSSVQEFSRVLKDGSSMLITTSASEKEDWFHKPSLGWCFSSQTLAKWFDIKKINFDYSTCYKNIINSNKLKNRISEYYKLHGDSGLPYANLMNAKYIPLGIVRQKGL